MSLRHILASSLACALVFVGVLGVGATAAQTATSRSTRTPPPPTEVRLVHDLEGPAAAALADLVMRFNQRQKGEGLIRIESQPDSPRGARLETAALALLDASDSIAFFGTRPRYRALDDLMRRQGSPLAGASLLPLMADAVDDAGGRLQALPLNLSLPVLLMNRGLLQRAAVEPTAPPTWWALQELAGKLYAAGQTCPLTTSHLAWVHLENLAAQSSEPMLQRQGASDRLLVNGMVSVKHLALLSSWQQSRYLHWFGPGREGDAHFLSGDCALITTASSLYVEAVARGIDVAVAPLPYYDDIYAPRAGETLPDGRSLWVLANSVNAAQEKLIARFVRYLLEPAVQREWVAKSGSLPMTRAAIDALREGGVFPPGLLAATQTRLSAARPRMARLKAIPARERFRLILGEEIEPVWTAHRAPKEALDRTVQRTDAAPEMRSR